MHKCLFTQIKFNQTLRAYPLLKTRANERAKTFSEEKNPHVMGRGNILSVPDMQLLGGI